MSGLRIDPPVRRADPDKIIWSAPYDRADRALAALVIPEGMVFVGWLCRHPLRPEGGRGVLHRKHSHKVKRGWSEDKNVGQSFDGAFSHNMSYGEDDKPICPMSAPVFVREDEMPWSR